MKGLILPIFKRGAFAFHRRLAHGPRWLARGYFELVSLASRNLLSHAASKRVRNSLCGYGHPWPELSFEAVAVILGKSVEVRLVPHLGEFDEEALFSRRLAYEPALFAWLEAQAGSYDLIVEIGANVGIYSIFLDALARRRPASERPRLVAYEPSPVAFRRLQRNLAENRASVECFQEAVGDEAGSLPFYEPAGHLTNGSFLRSFAAQFSDQIVETRVTVVAAADLEQWLKPARRALIKIDVEGFEPKLVRALAPLLERYRPDVLMEVLPDTVAALADDPLMTRFDKHLVTKDGLRPEDRLYFSKQYYDWLLRWRSAG